MYNGTSPIQSVVWVFLFGILTMVSSIVPAVQAQRIPQGVQQQLEEQGMTAEEAYREALRLGIDLDDPEAAVRRARQLGIPESMIQQMLAAVEVPEEAPQLQPGEITDREVPVLSGRPIITPELLILPEPDPFFTADPVPAEKEQPENIEGDTLIVRVPVRDEMSGIAEVDIFFLNEGDQDTLYAFSVRRILGSNYDGIWQAMFIVTANTPSGNWRLFAKATDKQGNDNIIDTGGVLQIRREGEELAEADSVTVSDSLVYFGYDLFEVRPEYYQPTNTGPIDDSYVVGPGDELRLIVFGAAEFQNDLVVDEEGRIFVPNVGQRTVAGTRLEDLREDMRLWLGRSYAGLLTDPPEVLMDLTLTRLRPVSVFVLGEVARPGRFPLSSNSSVFNALYTVGGPRTSGSLRNVQVVRRGQLAYAVDLYEYLLKGYSPGDARLQTGDNVFIPPRGKTVAIKGQVLRPAIYELKPGEQFTDILAFAGGLKAEAYTRRFQIERVIPFEERQDPLQVREVLDFDLTKVLRGEQTVNLADGDLITIFSIPEKSTPAAKSRVRAVSISGAVNSPGRYEISDSIRTIRNLIEQADGLTGDAYFDKVELYRLRKDLRQEVVSLNLSEIMDDVPTQNLVLQPQDSLHVYSLEILQEKPTVRISGAVRNPGSYDLLENMSVIDLLFKGGGLADPEHLKGVFKERADLFRRSLDGRSEEIVPFHLGDALHGEGMAHETLRPGDEIRVYPLEVEVLRQPFVEISGAVKRPGQYRFREKMTLEDLILQAGGFEEGAYLREMEVTRLDSTRDTNELATSIMVPFMTSSESHHSSPSFGIKDEPARRRDARLFKLQHLDRVFVRRDPDYREQQTVLIEGEIGFPGTYTLLRENETLTDLVRRAGGVLPTGYPKGGRLLRDNLQVIVQMDRALMGDATADIVLLPGDQVTIPLQPNTVALRGNVANEGLIKYETGRRVKYYLNRAGGLRPDTEAILLTQASGATFRVKRRGIFKSNPVVDEGARILVTRKPPKEPGERVDIGRTIVESVGLISSTLTIVVLARQAFK